MLLISAVGFVGLNRGLDPRNVHVIQAHAIIIQLTSSGPGNTLGFQVNSTCDSLNMAPGDVCTAAVGIENTGEGAYRLSAPTLEVTGPLTTCGGGFFNVQIQNLSYVPNVDIIDLGDTESFNVVATLGDAPNECQDQDADILITLVATATDDGATPTPTPTLTIGDVVAPNTPGGQPPSGGGSGPNGNNSNNTNDVAGARDSSGQSGSGSTFTAEVLPARFPSTGQGYVGDETGKVLQTLFIGLALIGIGCFVLALRLRSTERSRE
jgi:hypothetical protein